MTASASISISIAGSMRRVTSTMVAAGRLRSQSFTARASGEALAEVYSKAMELT